MGHDQERAVQGKGAAIFRGKRHVAFVVVVLVIIALVLLHLVAVNSIYKAGGFSLKQPLSYWVIGGFLLLVALKLRYLWRFKNSVRKHFKK